MQTIRALPVVSLCFLFTLSGCKPSEIEALSGSPSVALAAPTYTGGNSAIDNVATASLAVTFNNAFETTLTAVSGTTSAAPAGLTVSTTGGVSCTAVAIVSPTAAGATINVSGCTGDGTVRVTVNAGAAKSKDGQETLVSAQRTVTVANNFPTVSLAVTDAIIPTEDGANTVTATFAGRVKNLSTTNASGEFTVTGCATAPSVAIANTVVSGNSVATATLSGGTCADGVTVSVELNLDKVDDLAGNAGDPSSNPTETFDVDSTVLVASLASATYPGSFSAINSSSQAELVLTFTNADTTTLADATGSTSAAPAGLTVSTTGGVSCTTVDLTSTSTSGATIQVSGCTGDGTVRVRVNAGTATSGSGLNNVASTQETVAVLNTAPTANLLAADATVITSDAPNVITANFDSLVQDLDASNSNNEFIISGCATPPTAAIAMSVVSGKSVATATLSGGVCSDGDTVTVELQRDQVTDIAGNTGTAGSNPSTSYAIDL